MCMCACVIWESDPGPVWARHALYNSASPHPGLQDSLWSIWAVKVRISHQYLAVSELFHLAGTYANILLSFTCALLKISTARDPHCPMPFSLLAQVAPHQKCKCLSNLTINSSIHLLPKPSRYKLNVKQTLNVKKKQKPTPRWLKKLRLYVSKHLIKRKYWRACHFSARFLFLEFRSRERGELPMICSDSTENCSNIKSWNIRIFLNWTVHDDLKWGKDIIFTLFLCLFHIPQHYQSTFFSPVPITTLTQSWEC